ncbi:MAG: gliding motility-associated C-terminal domain-containing protein [Flavobacteriales bacterium]|nr:gliding motility-associated C-terminal domain-containing protein [Flavobacteriales bacterium]
MKDNLQHLFRDRFQGHEAPVDPSAWQAIQGQLAASAPAADGLNDLFRERFSGHEMEVDPSVWQGVSSQLGHTAAAGAGASATVWGWVAAATGAVVITAAALLWANDEPAQMTAALPQAQVIEEPVQVDAAPKGENGTTTGPAAIAPQTPAQSGPEVVATNSALAQRATGVDGEGPSVDRTSTASSSKPASPTMMNVEPATGPQLVNGTDKVERILQALAEQAKVEAPELQVAPPVQPAANEPEESIPFDVERPSSDMPKLFIPNVFTPNNDGVNDTFKVEGEGFARVLVKVFAMKNNQLVFSTSNGEAWTGANCEDGIYLVAVEALTHDGRSVTEGKVVWLNPPMTR